MVLDCWDHSLLRLNNSWYFYNNNSFTSCKYHMSCLRDSIESIFPAGVGPGPPSRDTANWLPSRFNLSVETRRWYGWLRMVVPGTRLFRAPIWCPSGGVATRERQGSLSTVAESLVVLYRVGTHQIRRRWRVARSSTSQGSAEPQRARIKGADREVSA